MPLYHVHFNKPRFVKLISLPQYSHNRQPPIVLTMLLCITFVMLILPASLSRAALTSIRTAGSPRQLLGPSIGSSTRPTQHCQPFYTTFLPGSVSQLSGVSPFVSVGPSSSYETSGHGLQMFLTKPRGNIVRQGHINNIVADGATINSTFLMQYVVWIVLFQCSYSRESVMVRSLSRCRHPQWQGLSQRGL